MSRKDDVTPRDLIASFAKGISVIRAFDGTMSGLTLTDVAKRTGLTRATARRFLLTLESMGFAERQAGQLFSLTPRILSLGHSYLSSMPMWRFAEPVLEQLVEDTGETCSLSVLDGLEVVYVLRIPVRRILNRISTVGSRLPAYCTSMGRILLSDLTADEMNKYLSKVTFERFTKKTVCSVDALQHELISSKRAGYSWVSGEIEENISGLAVPVYNERGKYTAALNMSVRRTDLDSSAFVRRYLPIIRRAASVLSSSVMKLEECSREKLSKRLKPPISMAR